MAIWTTYANANHDIYTIVYLLKDALRSALDDAWFFERTTCPKPDVKGAGHAEIAARLGRFRDTCNVFKEREAMMLTKLVRAREWASQLRKLTPEIQEDVDQFLDATSQCQQLQAGFLRDAQRMFHGGGSLSRFLAQRQAEDGFETQKPKLANREYLVGGRTALFELRVACEVFLSQINDEFFSAPPHGQENAESEMELPYIDAPEEQPSALPQPQALH